MPLYQGRALRAGSAVRRPRRPGRLRAFVRVVALLGVVAALAHLPWESWRTRWAVVDQVEVRGATYLDPARVAAFAGVREGQDLLTLDLARARQSLLATARIADARVSRRGLRGVHIAIAERTPILLVHHGDPWELDSAGVLLAPLAVGAVADVPLLVGADAGAFPEGTQLRTVAVQRGVSWVRALGARELQLDGRVSEIDVTEPRSTSLLLLSGTRVLVPAWPPDLRRLSALRVVLADLDRRGTLAREVDVRYEDQVIVRPADPPEADAVATTS